MALDTARVVRAQRTTLLTLFGGYVGYYFCRSHLSVASPLILERFGGEGISKDDLGFVVSIGVGTYAIGKLLTGPLADRFGGRRLFLSGMIASAAATGLAALLGLAASWTSVAVGGAFFVFAVLWGLNRFAQSIGWVALVRVVGRWFPVGRHATVMGILSLSFLLGDALVRLLLGGLIRLGETAESDCPLRWFTTWPVIFGVAAVTLGVIAAVTAWFLRESPTELGLPEPAANPINVYADARNGRDRVAGSMGDSAEQSLQGERSLRGHALRDLGPGTRGGYETPTLIGLLAPLLTSPLFWLVCGMSFGLTLIRETVNFWTPTYLNEVAGLAPGEAALASTLSPIAGAVASVLAGWLSDKIGGRHGRIILPSLGLLVADLVLLTMLDLQGRPAVALGFVTAASFFLIGPYTYLAGVIALDLGGKTGSSTASGLCDSAGYVGALVSGWGAGWLAERHGWQAVFGMLLGVCLLTAIVAAAFLFVQERRIAQRGVRNEEISSG